MKTEVKFVKARAIDRLQVALRDVEWAYGKLLNAKAKKKQEEARYVYRSAMSRLIELAALAKRNPAATVDVPVVK